MISVIVPHRVGESCDVTLKTLAVQTFRAFEIITVQDTDARGANWARNFGAEMARGDFLLFSDNDIHWYSNALGTMWEWLQAVPAAAYCYGRYEMGGKIYCNQKFDAELLRQRNYISTMSLIRREDFPGFDEDIKRLQDWALWLKMLKQSKVGVYCDRLLFSTKVRAGISAGKDISYEEAAKIVQERYL